jgi:hypothetical protein
LNAVIRSSAISKGDMRSKATPPYIKILTTTRKLGQCPWAC